MKTSGIGGQAVMEGVMMRNGEKYAVAVRKPDNTIELKKDTYKSATTKSKFFKLPIVRGVVAFVDSLVLGFSTLTYSSEILEEDDENYEPKGFEKFLIDVFKEKAADVVMTLVVLFSIALAVGIFVLLPTFLAGLLGGVIKSELKRTFVEGIIRLVLFLLYVWIISLMKDIKRTYMYHGAEHKCINCIENGLDLTIDNVRESSRFHKRCGTSFLFIVMFISIILFMFVRTDRFVLKILFRLLLIPVISGISFEFIRLAGSKENVIFDILSAPGLLLQRLTTSEPDDDMIEVAIASVEAVFDWKSFVAKVRREEAGMSDKDFEIEAKFEESIVAKESATDDDNSFLFDLDLEDVDAQQYEADDISHELEEPVHDYYEEQAQDSAETYYEEQSQDSAEAYYEEQPQDNAEAKFMDPLDEVFTITQEDELPKEAMETLDNELSNIISNDTVIPEELLVKSLKELKAEAKKTRQLAKREKKKQKKSSKKKDDLEEFIAKNVLELDAAENQQENDKVEKQCSKNDKADISFDESENRIDNEMEADFGEIMDIETSEDKGDIEEPINDLLDNIYDNSSDNVSDNISESYSDNEQNTNDVQKLDRTEFSDDAKTSEETQNIDGLDELDSLEDLDINKDIEELDELESFVEIDDSEGLAEIEDAEGNENSDDSESLENFDDDFDDDFDDENIGIKGLFGRFKSKKQRLTAKERIARHKTLSVYDEDYDESDELLKTLDMMFSEGNNKEKSDDNE